jgi:hypothetical protein
VLPLMERFSEESGQAAHLVVLSRAQTVVLATTSGHLDASVIVRPGYGRPALDANSGLLILAFQSAAQRLMLMKDADPAEQARLSEPSVAEMFAGIRTLGHKVAPSRDILAVTDIACPVIGPAGYAQAAILVPCLQRHGVMTDENAILQALKACCVEAGSHQAHSPLRNTGTRRPSAWTPSMSTLSEPIIQSMWMKLLLPPCAAICSGVSLRHRRSISNSTGRARCGRRRSRRTAC